jgi:predicted cupin superfamily sugar epimerase
MDAQTLIKKLGLVPLPEEGGYYRETFRDARQIPQSALPGYGGPRAASTSILYLITPDGFSGLHAVKSTEVFHFYAGDAVRMVQIDGHGQLTTVVLGNDLEKNQVPQATVAPMIWQGTKLVEGGAWALLGCTVAPGFDFDDYVHGRRADLTQKFPQHAEVIREFTSV